MHPIHAENDHVPFLDSHRFGAILASADRQRSVPNGLAPIAWERRVEAESLLNGVLQIAAGLEFARRYAGDIDFRFTKVEQYCFTQA